MDETISPIKTQKDANSSLWAIIILLFTVSVIEAWVIYGLVSKPDNKPETQVKSESTDFFTTPPPALTPTPFPKTTSYPLNKAYSFPIRDAGGVSVSEISLRLRKYEFTNEVVYGNRKALMVNGREVFVVEVEVTNNFNQGVEFLARDYFRLSVNNEDKWVSPDMHDDPVDVRPNSTKTTRLGFPINVTDSNIKLKVGEINEEREIISIVKIP